MTEYGPGFHRMKKRLGQKQLEALRQDTIKIQNDARKVLLGETVTERNRETYKDYPKPRRWIVPSKPGKK